MKKKQPTGATLKSLGEKSSEIKDGGQEMTTKMQNFMASLLFVWY